MTRVKNFLFWIIGTSRGIWKTKKEHGGWKEISSPQNSGFTEKTQISKYLTMVILEIKLLKSNVNTD